MLIVAYWYGQSMFKKGFGVGVVMGFRWIESFSDCDATDIYISHCEEFPEDCIDVVEPMHRGNLVRITSKKLTFYEK